MLPRSRRIWITKSKTSPLDQALIQSGMILSTAQSPPPITFPALADAILIFVLPSVKKDFI